MCAWHARVLLATQGALLLLITNLLGSATRLDESHGRWIVARDMGQQSDYSEADLPLRAAGGRPVNVAELLLKAKGGAQHTLPTTSPCIRCTAEIRRGRRARVHVCHRPEATPRGFAPPSQPPPRGLAAAR